MIGFQTKEGLSNSACESNSDCDRNLVCNISEKLCQCKDGYHPRPDRTCCKIFPAFKLILINISMEICYFKLPNTIRLVRVIETV